MAWLLLDLTKKSTGLVWPNLWLALSGMWQEKHQTYE
jgi:hypothetical protein